MPRRPALEQGSHAIVPFAFFPPIAARPRRRPAGAGLLCWPPATATAPTELPESYGHGSSHQKSYTDHQTDSRNEFAQLFRHPGH